MRCCKNCDAIQDHPEGTGPPRKKFNQPTMYDHMESFCEFKRQKAQEEEAKAIAEKCLKYDSKFTNFNTDASQMEESLRASSNQHVVKMKIKSQETEGDNRGNVVKKSKSIDSLINISRSPINCPVSACKRTIGITSVLSHFLRDHRQRFPVDFQDIDGGRRSVLIFDENIFNYNENVCLGILAYGGKESNESSRPALCGICRSNSFLPERYSQYTHHLPILIMGCKTSLSSLLTDKELAEELFYPDDRTKDLIVIWLATVETTKPLHCTITAFDHAMTSSRSTIVEIRNLKYSQSPATFLSEEINYLMLNRGDISILSMNEQASIEIEILIHEFE